MEGHKKGKIYYSMGEVAEMFDVNQSLIRYWEQKFDILKPHKNKKGNRMFTPGDVDNLKLIYHLVKEKGMTLAGAQKRIKENKEGLQRDIEIVDRLLSIRSMLLEIRQELKMGGEDFTDEEQEEPYSQQESTVEADIQMQQESPEAEMPAADEGFISGDPVPQDEKSEIQPSHVAYQANAEEEGERQEELIELQMQQAALGRQSEEHGMYHRDIRDGSDEDKPCELQAQNSDDEPDMMPKSDEQTERSHMGTGESILQVAGQMMGGEGFDPGFVAEFAEVPGVDTVQGQQAPFLSDEEQIAAEVFETIAELEAVGEEKPKPLIIEQTLF